MVEQKPANLFSSNTFISLVIVVLSAAQPSIVDIAKNGGTFEKYFNLVITLFGAIGVAADKVDKEKNVYTPKWFPLGRNPEDIVTVAQPVVEVTEKVAEVTGQVNDKVDSALKSPLNLLKLR
ncbi:hypothetical protein Pam2_12 [Pseudanabaena phage Pam2]|nr:hypothetical protein Pam2_12 [Pseudanabaena phage Pam2]